MGDDPISMPGPVADRLDELARQLATIEEQLTRPDVLGDHRRVRELSIRKSAIGPLVARHRRFGEMVRELAELEHAVRSGEDPELAQLAVEEIPELRARCAGELDAILHDLVNAEDESIGSLILEVRAGTGGDEAALWARDLLHVYEQYAKHRGWSFEPMDLIIDDATGGVRHAIIAIAGPGAWRALSFEAGVHSVKRVPATESQGRIHTSTATVAVLPEPEEPEVRIDWDNDVREHITTAQGPGGQNVNKVATACHLVHVPTGVEVRMQETKSQHQNREKARRLLLARVAELERQRTRGERDAERRNQIGSGQRSEKVRVYRYQDGIVADQRLDQKFPLRDVLDGQLGAITDGLIEQDTIERIRLL